MFVELTVSHICLLLVYHFVADFMFQTDKMALNKSTSNKWLGYHVLVYSFIVSINVLILVGFIPSLIFFGITFVTHFITDWITSRLSSMAHKNDHRSLFFKIIGADQMIHGITLVISFSYILQQYGVRNV